MLLLKKLGRGLAATLLKFSLLALALSIALLAVFGSPKPIKNALEKSGIYNSFVDNIIEESQKQKTAKAIPVERPEIQIAAKAAFTPDFLRASTEDIIDSSYDWLSKKTAEPQFRIDMSGPKQTFINSLGDYAVQRAKSLPACTLQDLGQIGNSFDPFSVPCVPPGFNVESLRGQVLAEINSQEEFLREPVITADNFSENEQGKSLFEQAVNVPEAFQWARLAPMLLGMMAMLAGGALIYLHDDRRRGIRSVSMALVGTGIFLLVFSGLLSFLFWQANRPDGSFGKAINNEFQQTALSVIGSLSGTYGQRLMLIGVVYALLGGAIWLGLRRTEPKTEKIADKTPDNELPPPSPNP